MPHWDAVFTTSTTCPSYVERSTSPPSMLRAEKSPRVLTAASLPPVGSLLGSAPDGRGDGLRHRGVEDARDDEVGVDLVVLDHVGDRVRRAQQHVEGDLLGARVEEPAE